MDVRLFQSYRPVCRACLRACSGNGTQQRQLTSTRSRLHPSSASQWKSSKQAHVSQQSSKPGSPSRTALQPNPARGPKIHNAPLPVSTPSEVDVGWTEAKILAEKVMEKPLIPTDEETMAALQAIKTVSERLVELQKPRTTNTSSTTTTTGTNPRSEEKAATGSLLSLDSARSKKSPTSSAPTPSASTQQNGLSTMAYRLLKHPPIFITTAMLDLYTAIQSLLNRPSSFPEIFDLYAHKPQPSLSKPKANSEPTAITYSAPRSPNAIKMAIPSSIANKALRAAMFARSLPTALSIIQTTAQTRASRNRRILIRALPLLAAVPATPLAAVTLASSMAQYQTGLDSETFTAMVSAGMITYAAAVGTIGYVALTSANDQMKRITWVPGTPLWQRWVREEERGMVDEVVQSFGFREKGRWGEEEGEEWEGMKEWCGLRGFVVDRVALMEGME